MSARRSISAALAIALATTGAVSMVTTDNADATTAALTEVRTGGGVFATASTEGWVLDFATGEQWSSPAVGDVTGDGVPEIIVGGLNSKVRVYSTAGALLTTIDPGGGSNTTKHGATHASPALGDLDSDGVDDIVIANTGGKLAAYSYRDRKLTQLANITVPPAFSGAIEGIFSTPAIGYIDRNATPDVVTTSWGQEMDAWSGPSLGKIPATHQWALDTIWSSPALGDVDGDGEVEIVYGYDCDGSSTHPSVDPRCKAGWQGDHIGGGFITAVKLDGSVLWNYFVDNAVIWSSPALADLNGDGRLDVVTGTGLYFQTAQAKKVIAINGATGKLMWEAPTAGIPVGSPAIGETDGDGRPEVYIVTRGGYLYSYDGENGHQRFRSCILDAVTSCPAGDAATHGGVALADIDGDGVIEAITQGEQRLRVFDSKTGAEEGSGYRSAYPYQLFASASTPTVASVNGKTWIVSALRGAGSDGVRNANDDLVVTVWESSSALGAAPWPTFKQNNARTSNAIPQAVPDSSRDEKFVRKMYQDFLSRSASNSDISYWTGMLGSGRIDRYGFATTLSRTDEWISTVITNFYRDTLGREPDAAGLRGWIDAARSGMPIAQIAAAFYSSPEYFSKVGHNDYMTWVADLYRKLLLREADSAGIAGWVGALQAGMPRDTVSFGFYQSTEKLGVRITALYQKLLGRAPEPGAIPNWAPFVANEGDLVLAAALAASNEYYNRAQQG